MGARRHRFEQLWGNRYLPLRAPRTAVHAMGGGIGQGLPMAMGAALAGGGRKTVALVGDGGLALNLGEFATPARRAPTSCCC